MAVRALSIFLAALVFCPTLAYIATLYPGLAGLAGGFGWALYLIEERD